MKRLRIWEFPKWLSWQVAESVFKLVCLWLQCVKIHTFSPLSTWLEKQNCRHLLPVNTPLLSLSPLSFPLFSLLLLSSFSPSSLCFNLYVRPFQPNLPRSKRDSETLPLPEPDMERLNLWMARAPPPKGHVPAVILGDRVGGPFLRLNPSVACAQLSQQPKCWAHTSVPRQNPVAYGQSPQKKNSDGLLSNT